jgi:hypothetical protein
MHRTTLDRSGDNAPLWGLPSPHTVRPSFAHWSLSSLAQRPPPYLGRVCTGIRSALARTAAVHSSNAPVGIPGTPMRCPSGRATQVLAALPLRCIGLYPVLRGVSSTRDGCAAVFPHRHGGRALVCVCPTMIMVGKPQTSAAAADALSTPGESYCCASARCLCRSLAMASQCSRHASSSPAKASKALRSACRLPGRRDNSCGRLTLLQCSRECIPQSRLAGCRAGPTGRRSRPRLRDRAWPA